MSKPENKHLTAIPTFLLLTVLTAASAHAQTLAAAHDNRIDATLGLAFAPRLRLSFTPAGFRLMPSPGARSNRGSRSSTISLMPMAAGPNLQVLGNGTIGRLTKWTGFTSSNSFLGNSTIFEDKFGNVGIGTDSPTSRLTVNGTIQASGGVSIIHDATLIGNGTSASPLGIAVPLALSGASSGFPPILQVTNTGIALGGGAIVGRSSGGAGVFGGSVTVGVAGLGEGSIGGQAAIGVAGTGADGFGAVGGIGVLANGGSSVSDQAAGGIGLKANGGNIERIGAGPIGGAGVVATGGGPDIGLQQVVGSGGDGVVAVGGVATGAGNSGGIGIEATGGGGSDGATPGLAGKFNGDVQITGNTLVTSAGKGIILKSPDGATCRVLSIDNSGNVVLTAISCP